MTAIEQVQTVMMEQCNLQGLSSALSYSADKATPLQNVLAVIGGKHSESQDIGFINYLGEQYNETQNCWMEQYGKRINMTVSLDIYAPRSLGAEACVQATETVENVLFFSLPSLGIRTQKLSWEEVHWDKTYHMFVLRGFADCQAYFLANNADDTSPISDFILKGMMNR